MNFPGGGSRESRYSNSVIFPPTKQMMLPWLSNCCFVCWQLFSSSVPGRNYPLLAPLQPQQTPHAFQPPRNSLCDTWMASSIQCLRFKMPRGVATSPLERYSKWGMLGYENVPPPQHIPGGEKLWRLNHHGGPLRSPPKNGFITNLGAH